MIALIQRALNQEKLNLLGFSHGSQIGKQYIERYREKIGRFVLDGILDYSTSARDMNTADSQAYENSLMDYFEWCNDTAECNDIISSAEPAAEDTSELFDRTVTRLEGEQLPAANCTAGGEKQCAHSNDDLPL